MNPLLPEVIAACAGDDRPAHSYLTVRGEVGESLTRDALFRRITARATAFRAHGLRAGDRVALVADDVPAFVAAFLASVWLGAVPVPVPPPPPMGGHAPWLADVVQRLALVRPRLTCASSGTVGRLLPNVPAVAYDTVGDHEGLAEPARPAPDEPVYLQFTSGSTGAPRAVVVTGASLAANCAAIAAGLALTPADVAVSWLPLHHDMGLVGFVCAALTAAVPVVLLPTAAFVRDPGVWMRTVSAHRGTATFGPGFAFPLAARHAGAQDLDLSGLRVLGCGGEPIRPAGIRHFLDAFRPAGLDPAAFTPAYGLAEATLAVSFGTGLGEDDDGAVDCGPPLPGHEVGVRDDAGRPVPPGRPGEIWVRGPSVAGGYLDEADDATFRPDGWLRTGDRGRLRAGHLHVTGRQKDVLIVRGVNVDPQRVEWAVGDVPGVHAGGVAAFTRPGSETEELVLVAEYLPSAPPEVADDVRLAVSRDFGLTVGDLVPIPPRTLPRTTSGKPRRQETRRRYLAGEL